MVTPPAMTQTNTAQHWEPPGIVLVVFFFVSMCVYMYVCTCMYVHVWMCINVCMFMNCVHVHVCLCIYVSVHVFVYVCMYLRVHVCMWVYMYTPESPWMWRPGDRFWASLLEQNPPFSFKFLWRLGGLPACSSVCRLGWLVSEPQESTCLCFISSGITSIHSWLFIVLDVGFGDQILARQAHYQLSYLPSPDGFLAKMHNLNFIRKGQETNPMWKLFYEIY